MTTVQFFLVLAGFVGGGAILINVVLGAIVRLRTLRNQPALGDIEARLERIEMAVETMAKLKRGDLSEEKGGGEG